MQTRKRIPISLIITTCLIIIGLLLFFFSVFTKVKVYELPPNTDSVDMIHQRDSMIISLQSQILTLTKDRDLWKMRFNQKHDTIYLPTPIKDTLSETR